MSGSLTLEINIHTTSYGACIVFQNLEYWLHHHPPPIKKENDKIFHFNITNKMYESKSLPLICKINYFNMQHTHLNAK